MARPREPWKRERLLDAAVAAASRTGLARVTIRDVAEEAGVSPATVHYHFADVDGVALGIVERALEQVYDARLEAIAGVEGAVGKLLALIELGIPDDVTDEVAFMYEGIPVLRSRPQFAPTVRSYVERQVSLYRSVIDAGVTTGVFTPTGSVDAIARNLVALEDAYVLYLVVGAMREPRIARRNLRSNAASVLGIELPA